MGVSTLLAWSGFRLQSFNSCALCARLLKGFTPQSLTQQQPDNLQIEIKE